MSKFQEYLEAVKKGQDGHFIEVKSTDDEVGDKLKQKISSALHRQFGVDEFYTLDKLPNLRYKFFTDEVFERAKKMFKDLGVKYKEIESWEEKDTSESEKPKFPRSTSKTLKSQSGYEKKFSGNESVKIENALNKAGIENYVEKHVPVRAQHGESLTYYTIEVQPEDYDKAMQIANGDK